MAKHKREYLEFQLVTFQKPPRHPSMATRLLDRGSRNFKWCLHTGITADGWNFGSNIRPSIKTTQAIQFPISLITYENIYQEKQPPQLQACWQSKRATKMQLSYWKNYFKTACKLSRSIFSSSDQFIMFIYQLTATGYVIFKTLLKVTFKGWNPQKYPVCCMLPCW